MPKAKHKGFETGTRWVVAKKLQEEDGSSLPPGFFRFAIGRKSLGTTYESCHALPGKKYVFPVQDFELKHAECKRLCDALEKSEADAVEAQEAMQRLQI